MNFWIIIWTILIFASVAWYGFLLFYIGAKGGRELIRMTQALSRKKKEADAK
jgi:hypothetical protein